MEFLHQIGTLAKGRGAFEAGCFPTVLRSWAYPGAVRTVRPEVKEIEMYKRNWNENMTIILRLYENSAKMN